MPSPATIPLFRKRSQLLSLILAAAGLWVSSIALLRLYDWNQHLSAFLSIFGIACCIYAVTIRLALHGAFDSIPRLSRKILVVAILLRATVFLCPPTISEDLYRYVWDGKVQNAGFGPYDFPPGAEQLRDLRDSDYQKINHKDFRTAYPPFAQILFRTLSRISTNAAFFKFVILLFEILLLLILKELLSRHRMPPAWLLIYAWHPLVVVEFAGSGHMDVIAICLLFVSLLLLELSRPALAGFSLAAAVLTKYLPAISLPWLLWRGGWKFGLVFVTTVIVLFIPYYTPDLGIFHGLTIFYRTWWFNDSVFGILREIFGDAEPARLTGAFVTGLVALFCLWKRFDFYRSFFLINATVIVFAPVVHPWYVCWLVPFLIFHRNPAWLFFTCWVAISYWIREVSPGAVWKHESWLKFLVYAPLYFVLLRDLAKDLIRARAVRRS